MPATITWKTRLNNHFRNTRKRGDRGTPEMARKIELAKTRKEKKHETYHSVKMWGIQNFKPKRLSGENDDSIAMHYETLEKEFLKMPNAQDKMLINNCHDKLFPERREFILEPPVKSVAAIDAKFPLLFSYKQILAEYTRLTTENLTESFISGVQKYLKLASFLPGKNEEKLLVDIRKMFSECAIEDRGHFYEQCVAVLIVPQQMKEKLSDFIYTDGENSSYPKIRIKSYTDTLPVEVIVEGVTFCECSDIISGIALMLCAYYVINIAYPKELKSTLFFYQKAFLNIADSSAKDAKVAKLLTVLLS